MSKYCRYVDGILIPGCYGMIDGRHNCNCDVPPKEWEKRETEADKIKKKIEGLQHKLKDLERQKQL